MPVFEVDAINSIEAELSFYRKGSLSVCIDLSRRILRWRESNRWNRNFTRSLSLIELSELRTFLHNCHFEDWQKTEDEDEDETADQLERFQEKQIRWTINLLTHDKSTLATYRGYDVTTERFRQFAEGISHFCRRPFQYID